MDDDLITFTEPARVLSPCVNVCVLDGDTGWCLGCARTGDEIAAWTSGSDAQRQGVLEQLPARMKLLQG